MILWEFRLPARACLLPPRITVKEINKRRLPNAIWLQLISNSESFLPFLPVPCPGPNTTRNFSGKDHKAIAQVTASPPVRSKVRDSEAAGSFAPDSRPSLDGNRPWARHRALCAALSPPRASVSTTDLHRKDADPPVRSGYVPGRLASKPCGLGFPAPRDSLLPQSPPQVGYLILSSRSPPGVPAPTEHLSCVAFPRRRASPGGGTRIRGARGRGGAARVRRGAESAGCPGQCKCSCLWMRWQTGGSAGGHGKVAAREK